MRRAAHKNRSILGRFILWSVLIIIVMVLGTAFYGYSWIQNYLKSDAFREQLALQIGRAAKADAVVESLSWTGSDAHVTAASLTPKRDQAWKSIRAGGIQATLDFGAARDGVWQVTNLSADSLRVDMRNAAEIPRNLPLEWDERIPSSVPPWLRRWIPNRTQIDEVRVQTFDFIPATGAPGVSATGITVEGRPATDTGAWQLRGEGGKLLIPGLAEPFRVVNLNTRLDSKAFLIHDSRSRWLGDSEVTARGDVPFEKGRPWSFNGSVTMLDLRHLLSPEWNSCLSGVLEGDYEAKPMVTKAKVRWKNGIAQSMPVLNTVADFTGVERFRRIVMDTSSAEIERSGDTIKVTNLDLRASGLMRVEGGFVIQQGQINGNLLVGVAPDTLYRMPGSRDHVFTDRRADAPGYVWTTVHIYGPATAPRQDLTNRLLTAMGRAVLIDTPIGVAEKGMEVLGKTGAPGTGAAKDVIGAGVEVIKGSGNAAEKAVETGVDLLKGLVPTGK